MGALESMRHVHRSQRSLKSCACGVGMVFVMVVVEEQERMPPSHHYCPQVKPIPKDFYAIMLASFLLGFSPLPTPTNSAFIASLQRCSYSPACSTVFPTYTFVIPVSSGRQAQLHLVFTFPSITVCLGEPRSLKNHNCHREHSTLQRQERELVLPLY